MATRAFILIETQVGRTKQILETLRTLKNVVYADIVTGNFDIIARVEAPDMRDIADLVTGQIQAIRGVTRTITCVSAG